MSSHVQTVQKEREVQEITHNSYCTLMLVIHYSYFTVMLVIHYSYCTLMLEGCLCSLVSFHLYLFLSRLSLLTDTYCGTLLELSTAGRKILLKAHRVITRITGHLENGNVDTFILGNNVFLSIIFTVHFYFKKQTHVFTSSNIIYNIQRFYTV